VSFGGIGFDLYRYQVQKGDGGIWKN